MNGQRKSVKNDKRQSIFTKETFGVVTVLFSTLCLVCLITGDRVFEVPGKAVAAFLFGLFGWFSYAVTIYLIALGVTLITGKKPQVSAKKKAFILGIAVCVVLFCHVLSMGGGFSSYGDYLKESYNRGAEGVATASAGGFIAGIFGYFFLKLLTVVGSCVVLGTAAAVFIYFLVADIIKENRRVKPDPEQFKSSYVKTETPEGGDIRNEQDDISIADIPVKKSSQKLFVADFDGFEFKTRKELQREQKAENAESGTSYSEGYSEEMRKKIAYIKTPAKIDLSEMRKVETVEKKEEEGTKISDYIPKRTEETSIPMIEHDETENLFPDDARSHAEEFGRRYASDLGEEKAFDTEDTEIPAEEEINPVDFVADEEETPEISETPETLQEEETESRPRRFGFDKEENEPAAFTSRAEQDGNSFRRIRFTVPQEEPEEQREEIKEEKPIIPINREYFRPPLDLLEDYPPPVDAPKENHEERMAIIRRTLEDFHINAEPKSFIQGPTITRYEISMPQGISVRKVLAYDDDLKMRLSSRDGVRIQAPIPGKDLVGIEVANTVKTTVGLKEIMQDASQMPSKAGSLVFAVGKDIVGKSFVDDLSKASHFLVAGATGSGKSVALNVMIISIIMRYSPEDVRLILIDPKRVGFRAYEHLPHLMIDEIITEPQKAIAVLQWAHDEMERRYQLFENCDSKDGIVSDIAAYNKRIASDTVPKLPRILVVVDELADLMESVKKDLDAKIRALAAKARAAGLHLILATQRPSVDVITGTIKANLPSRMALKVMSHQDSATILGGAGAEKLLGNGDMLYKNATMPECERYQGAWISDREINNVVSYVKEKNAAYFNDDLKDYLERAMKPKQEEVSVDTDANGGGGIEINDFFLKALWHAVNVGSISISQLQRRFQIGFTRAGGIFDKMERLGYIAGNEGQKTRRVLLTKEQFEQEFGSMPDDY